MSHSGLIIQVTPGLRFMYSCAVHVLPCVRIIDDNEYDSHGNVVAGQGQGKEGEEGEEGED